METIKKFIKKCKENPGTIIGFVGLVGLLLGQFGVNVDMEWLKNTAVIGCALLVVVGVCNNPETPGVSIPGFDKAFLAPKKETLEA